MTVRQTRLNWGKKTRNQYFIFLFVTPPYHVSFSSTKQNHSFLRVSLVIIVLIIRWQTPSLILDCGLHLPSTFLFGLWTFQTSRIQLACSVHRHLCHILLAARESMLIFWREVLPYLPIRSRPRIGEFFHRFSFIVHQITTWVNL